MNLETVNAADLCRGYAVDPDSGVMCCLSCNASFEPGEIYPGEDGRLFEAQRAARRHVSCQHPHRVGELIRSPSKYNTLTENQRKLLELFSAKVPDKEIARHLGVSTSTVRHQKFMFREKAKQARLYLAVYELVFSETPNKESEMVPIHENATMVDQRYVITAREQEHILSTAFHSLEPLKLKTFSPKEKKKLVILSRISTQFQPGRRYTESEVNDILREIFDDFVTLRRYLIEYGFMKRTTDGAEYWLAHSGE